jgi:hypothetical protein
MKVNFFMERRKNIQTKFLKKMVWSTGILVSTFSTNGNFAVAAKWADTPAGLDLLITSVFVDFETSSETLL